MAPECVLDYGFRGPATLPRRVFRGTNQRAIGEVVAGPPVDALGLISQGSTQDNQVRFARKGRYAMVCFFGEHNRLGMTRVYRVR